MAENFKFYIKFVGMLIIFLIIFMVTISDFGIASNVFNYLTYVEPLLIQDYISSAFIVGSTAPGEFTSTFKTSGQPYTIEVFPDEETGYIYVSVEPTQEIETVQIETKFATIDPTVVVTDCDVQTQKIELQKNLVQTITVRKTEDEGGCKLYLDVYTEENEEIDMA
jgi:hypothetical protein